MFMLALLPNANDDGGIRIVLLMLVIVAVILLAAGGVIAVLTFLNVRKSQHLQSSHPGDFSGH